MILYWSDYFNDTAEARIRQEIEKEIKETTFKFLANNTYNAQLISMGWKIEETTRGIKHTYISYVTDNYNKTGKSQYSRSYMILKSKGE